jgi:hypothetical protein
MTSDWLDAFIDEQIDSQVDSIFLLDNKLRSRMVLEGASIDQWIVPEKREELEAISPSDIEVAPGLTYRLSYSHGKPFVNGINSQNIPLLPREGVFLPDGREVLFSFNLVKDTKKYTVRQLQESMGTLA